MKETLEEGSGCVEGSPTDNKRATSQWFQKRWQKIRTCTEGGAHCAGIPRIHDGQQENWFSKQEPGFPARLSALDKEADHVCIMKPSRCWVAQKLKPNCLPLTGSVWLLTDEAAWKEG